MKLYKDFTQLEAGRDYTFSVWVREVNGAPAPRLVLVAQGREITEVIEPGSNWQLLAGVFTATSTNARLTFDNLRMGISPINDYEVTGITVEEV